MKEADTPQITLENIDSLLMETETNLQETQKRLDLLKKMKASFLKDSEKNAEEAEQAPYIRQYRQNISDFIQFTETESQILPATPWQRLVELGTYLKQLPQNVIDDGGRTLAVESTYSDYVEKPAGKLSYKNANNQLIILRFRENGNWEITIRIMQGYHQEDYSIALDPLAQTASIYKNSWNEGELNRIESSTITDTALKILSSPIKEIKIGKSSNGNYYEHNINIINGMLYVDPTLEK